MSWHGYMAVEDLALNGVQRETLMATIRRLGTNDDPMPDRRNHWRVRNDSRAVIFEAAFDEQTLTVEVFKTRLAGIFGVNANTVDDRLTSITLDKRATPVETYSRGGTDYLRIALFGGTDATWKESATEARAYLTAHRDAWEVVTDEFEP